MNNNQKTKRISRLIRLAVLAVSAIMLFSMLALFAFAADSASPYDAQFGELYYENLSDAIEAANSSASGGTVTVLRDVNLAECLTISKDVTLTGKYTIYRADSYTAGLFTVDAGVTLTLDGGITLDGGNEWVLDYDAFHTDIQKEEFLVSGMSYVTAEPSAPVATAHMISIYGSLVMNKATVQNNYGGTSLTTAPFRLYQGATLTMNDGAVARHNYIEGDSALVHCNSRYATWTINDGAEITENYSTGVGGLSFFYYSYVEMNGGEMHDNYVCGKEGSIFKLYNGARFTMNDGYIHDNYAFAMSGAWGGTISVHYTSDAATTGNYSTFTMNGGVVGPNYGNGRTTLVGNGYNKPLLYLNGGKVINVDGYNGVSGSYLYYTADSGVMEGGTIEGDSVDIRKDFTNNGTINSNVNLINKANATVYGNGVVNGNLYLDPDKNTVSACISGCTWNGDVILSNIANAVLSGGTYNGNIIVPDGATLSITGGQFKNSPIEYLAAGSQSFYDAETGLYTVYSGNVASFGGAEYATLADAIAAANTAGGGEVSLLRSTYISEQIDVSSNITLIGDYIISRAKAPLENYTGTLFNVSADATLTLDGGITIDGGNEWALDYDTMYETMMSSPTNVASFTFATPESGAPVASDYMFKVSGNVVLGDATIQNNYGKVLTAVFKVASTATVTLNSGARVTHNAAINLENANKVNASVAYIANDGHLIVNNGAEISRNHMVGNNSSLAYMEGSFTVNGGEIYDNSSVNCGGLVAMIDNTGLLTVNGGHIHDNINVVKNGANAAGIFFVYGTARFIMNGGLVEKNYSSGTTVIYAYSASSVELNGGTIRQEQRATSSGYSSYIAGNVVIDDDMVIEGGLVQFKKNLTTKATIDSNVWFASGVTAVQGGTFNGDVRVANNLTITGGTFNGAITVDSGYTLSIKGGLFKQDPSAYLAQYCDLVYNDVSGYYEVIKYYEASFDGVNYDSLEEAVAAAIAAGGGRVTLLHDVDLDSSIMVSSDVEICGDYTILRSASYTDNLFTVNAGATLTLDGGVIVNGNNDWVLDYDALYNCMMANGAGITTATFCTAEADAPKTAAHVFNVSGNVVVNNATIKNHYISTSVSIFNVASGASVTLNDGATITHNATLKCKVMASVAASGSFIINEGSEISYNHSSEGNGSLSYVTGSMVMNGGEVHHNTQTLGGGVLAYIAGSLVINGGHLYENMDVQESGSTSSLIYSNTAKTTFIMNGGLIEKNYSNGATTIYIKPTNSIVELNGGIIRQEHRAIPGNYSSIFNCTVYFGEDMVIEGGILRIQRDSTTKGTFNCDVQFGANVTNVSEGTYNGDIALKNSPTMTISGGVWNGGITVDAGGTLAINGGQFKEDPTQYLANYHEAAYDEASGYYTIIKYYEASFGGVNYDSLEEAVAAATAAGGGRVTLLHDVDLDSSVAISCDVEIYGDYTILRSKSYTGNLFTVAAGATLTLDGGVVFDGGNNWTLDYDLLLECMLADGSTSVATSFATTEQGGVVATDYMFNISGSVIMGNVTVTNNYQTTGIASPFIVNNGGTLTMNSGASITHNASTGGSNCIILVSTGGQWIINDGVTISFNHFKSTGGIAEICGIAIMNGGDVHDNSIYCSSVGAGSFVISHNGGSFTMNDGHVYDNISVVKTSKITSGAIYIHENGTFIMNGGVIENNRGNRSNGIYAYTPTSVMQLNAGVLRHTTEKITSATSSYTQGPIVIGEDMVIENGIFRLYTCSDITINGTLKCELQIARVTGELNMGGTLDGRLLVYDNSSITVTGGTYLGGFKIYSGVTFAIEGGLFRENPSEWLGEGYGAVYSNESEMFDVQLIPVAAIGETKYDTITEALDAAVDGDVITIAASHKIRESITVAKNVTIDTGNQTIIVDKSVAVAFVIKANTTFRGNGTVNTDNGNTAVFAIGDADTEGSLTIESGSYIGDSTVASVDNGSLTISGGDFSVNPDVAEGEVADHSALLTVSEGADASVLITGGRFRSFNPEQAGNYLEDSHDAFEESDDYYSILTHLFEHYISDGNATCASDGTKTAKCKFCELTDTITEVGSMLQHVFSHYVSDGNATCTSDGTKTAKCDRCDATYTVTDNNSDIGHSFTVYKSNGDATCEKNGTKTAKCDRCDEERTIMDGGTKLNHTYSGVICTECGAPRIWLVAVIVLAVFAFLSFGMLLVV